MLMNEVKDILSHFSGAARLIAFPKILMKMCGKDSDIAIFLSQLMYWHDRSKDGWVYKTYEDFDNDICLSRRKVRKAKDFLESKGWIETDFKQVTDGTPKLHYRVADKLIKDMSEYVRVLEGEENPENSDHNETRKTTWPKRSVGGDRNGQLEVTETVSSIYKEGNVLALKDLDLKDLDLEDLDLKKDPDQEKKKEKETPKERERATKVPYDEIVEIFHRKCPSLRAVQKITDFRKNLLNARWKEHPSLEFWEEYFETVSKSQFLMGEVNDFQANFEWLIRPNNFIKVLEGNYNDKEKKTELEKYKGLMKLLEDEPMDIWK